MRTTTVAPPKPSRSWPYSIGLFTVATIGEFIALVGWYVLHHANPPIGSSFYRQADRAVAWMRDPGASGSSVLAMLAPVGDFLQSRHTVLAVLVLCAGFLVERSMVVIWLRVPPLIITPAGHLRSRWRVLLAVTIAEIVVWVAWIGIAEAHEPAFAAAILATGIHLVHAYEVAVIKHRAFPPLLTDPGVVAITVLEAVGGVLALRLATRGFVVWPILVVLAALLTEHLLQVAALKKEADGRQ